MTRIHYTRADIERLTDDAMKCSERMAYEKTLRVLDECKTLQQARDEVRRLFERAMQAQREKEAAV